MKNIIVLIIALLVSFSASALEDIFDASSYTGKNYAYALLLSDTDNEKIRIAAKSIYKDLTIDLKLVDLTALRLSQLSTETDLGNDTVAWCARVLEKYGTMRHKSILLDVLEKNDSNKVENYVKPAIRSVSTRTDDTKLPELSKSFTQFQQELRSAFKEKVIVEKVVIKTDDTIESAILALGLPIDEKVISFNKHLPFVGKLVITDLEMIFARYGAISFRREEKSDNTWVVADVFNNPLLTNKVLRSQYGEYISGIYSNSANAIREMAARINKEKLFDIALLDHAAERLILQNSLDISKMEDAMAWLCRILGESKNGRYNGVLETIIKNTKSNKLKKYAQSALKKLEVKNEAVKYRQGMAGEI